MTTNFTQQVRGQPAPGNPSGLATDILAIGRAFTGSGAPVNVPGAIVYSKYTDTSAGIEYQLNEQGVWQPLVDYSSFAPPPSDPLSLNRLNVNEVHGNSGDGFILDGGNVGTVQVVSENIGAAFQVGTSLSPDNIILQNNGYANIKSGVRTYDVQVDNYTGRQLKIEANGEYKIKVQGTPDVLKVESALDNDIQLITDGTGKISVVKNLGGQIDIDPQNNKISSNASPFTLSSNITNVESLGGSLNLKATSYTQVQDLSSGKAIVLDATSGTIAGNPDAPFVIQNLQANQDLDLKTVAAGNINLRSGSSNIVCHNPLQCNTFGLTTASINGSQGLTQYKNLSVNPSGVLGFSNSNHAVHFTFSNVGGNGTSYGLLSGMSPVNPGDFGAYYMPFAGARINMMSTVLIYSSAWSFNSGTAVLELVRVPTGQAVTAANAVLVTSLNIPTGTNFYQYSLGSNTDISAPNGKYGMRLVVTGAASTSTTAEVVATVFFN